MQPNNRKELHAIERYGRELDPIATNTENFDDTRIAEYAHEDIGKIDEMLATDTSLTSQERYELYYMGCNLRLEWLYADHGGGAMELNEFNQHLSEANDFFNQAGKDAQASHDAHPQRLWGVALKHQDLLALQVFRNAKESQTTLKGTVEGQHAWTLAENQMGGLFRRSLGLMQDMQSKAQGEGKIAQDARGTLYEALLLTYGRLKTYEDQSFDEIFIRSALDREDRPWNNHEYPKRSFDIAVEGPDGKRLLQVKNYRNEDEYAAPIEKVMANGFGRTLDTLGTYVADLRIVVNNPSDPNLKDRLNLAARRLDQVFGSQLAPQESKV